MDLSKTNIKSESGFSLMEILVAISILSIISMAMMTMSRNTAMDQKALSEKFELLALENSILTMMKNPTTCAANFRSNAVNLSDAQLSTPSASEINLTELHVGSTAATPLLAKVGESLPGQVPGHMVVSAIKINRITANGTANEYSGTLTVEFDASTLSRSFKPISINQVFVVSSPASAVVANCGSAVTSGATADSGGSGSGRCPAADLWPTMSIAICSNGAQIPNEGGIPNCAWSNPALRPANIPAPTHIDSGFPTQVFGSSTCLNGIWVPNSNESGGTGNGIGDRGDSDGG